MFSGIIEDLGTVIQIKSISNGKILVIRCDKLDLSETKIGDSIATNGVCLTVTDFNRENNTFSADVSHETVNITNLKDLKVEDKVQLERALKLSDRINGHIVTGHVDGTGYVKNIIPGRLGTDYILEYPKALAPFIAQKGSIAVNGTSLTVNDVTTDCTMRLTIIPHTQSATLIGSWKVGTAVNLEVDVVARYLSQLMKFSQPLKGEDEIPAEKNEVSQGLTRESLIQAGFL